MSSSFSMRRLTPRRITFGLQAPTRPAGRLASVPASLPTRAIVPVEKSSRVRDLLFSFPWVGLSDVEASLSRNSALLPLCALAANAGSVPRCVMLPPHGFWQAKLLLITLHHNAARASDPGIGSPLLSIEKWLRGSDLN